MDMYTAQVERVKAACVAIDRDPRTMKFTVAQFVVCGANESEIARRAKAVNREPDELRKNGLCGTPSEVAARLVEWHNAGAETCYLQILDLNDIEHLELIAAEVMPYL
jgi:alkanesulfonate monooxygenase SsuD/methylene tetrahydromethanopterin reductase-like flavin-dependent oxidoreductase (luciferase family)